jgi:hypothetical protein
LGRIVEAAVQHRLPAIARALKLTLPQSLVLRADRVIE